jgi:hypothetical protein
MDNPQPSPKVYNIYIYYILYTMDAVQRLDGGGGIPINKDTHKI